MWVPSLDGRMARLEHGIFKEPDKEKKFISDAVKGSISDILKLVMFIEEPLEPFKSYWSV